MVVGVPGRHQVVAGRHSRRCCRVGDHGWGREAGGGGAALIWKEDGNANNQRILPGGVRSSYSGRLGAWDGMLRIGFAVNDDYAVEMGKVFIVQNKFANLKARH